MYECGRDKKGVVGLCRMEVANEPISLGYSCDLFWIGKTLSAHYMSLPRCLRLL